MSVRNCGELGVNVQKIVKRLMANDNLVKLLYYTDADPLEGQTLTEDQKRTEIFNKLIKIIPKVDKDTIERPVVAIYVNSGSRNENDEYRDIYLIVDVIVPLTQWIIKDTNLRPFAILGEIQRSLDNVTINGLGKINIGDFELRTLTDEVSIYEQALTIVEYD